MELTTDQDVRLAHSRDASGLQLVPESVARATDSQDVVEIVRSAMASGDSVTPAGSQTSMTGASISDRGTLLSLSGMKRVIDVDFDERIARVEPGITIGELNGILRERGLQFAPDPTSENDATIGGAIACNASGARSLRYGATRRHVLGVTVVHADAAMARYERPRLEKNTVGYSVAQDPVDWFVGSEGTLGIVVEAELSLVPLPVEPLGLAIPFRSEAAALSFVIDARRRMDMGTGRAAQCLEFFDVEAVEISGNAIARPWSADAKAMVYLEDDGSADDVLDVWLALSEEHDAISDDIRVYEGLQPLRDARVMRHAVPSQMNERGARFVSGGGRKVSTDWAVPYRLLATALDVSREACARHGVVDPVTYGHAGNGHPHQNFIAENADDLKKIHAAIEETLVRVLSLGGTVSAEHGLGKLKKEWLKLQLAERQIDVMRALKHALDPNGLLSPGNVL